MPRKTLLLGLMAVFTLGNLASVLAPTYGTLMAARFVAGLPHGAFFGIAALVAAHLMGPKNRAKAVAHVMTGLTVATVLGVPLASWLGQALGWRSAFGLVVGDRRAHPDGAVVLAAASLRSMHATSPLTELGALRRPQVWLALLVGMVGFGGMFAVYTYVSTTLTDVAGLSRRSFRWRSWSSASAWSSATWSAARLADRSVVRALYAVDQRPRRRARAVRRGAHTTRGRRCRCCSPSAPPARPSAPALQTRLMDVAHGAQTLAAALNHSALNIANATGAWVGGLVIAAGYGYTAPAAAGAVLAVAGLVVLTVSVALQRRRAAI